MTSATSRSLSSQLWLGVLASGLLAGCFAPSVGVDELEPGTEPPGALFGGVDAPSGPSGPCGTAASSLTSLRVRVRTSSYGGKYSPRNIGAIWIADAQGTFVKTIEEWGKTRSRYLVRFNAETNGNLVDAITSATLSNHVTHDRTWDLQGMTPCQVADGGYRVVIEGTDKNGAGPTLEIPFTKGAAPVTLTPTETAYFHDLLVELK